MQKWHYFVQNWFFFPYDKHLNKYKEVCTSYLRIVAEKNIVSLLNKNYNIKDENIYIVKQMKNICMKYEHNTESHVECALERPLASWQHKLYKVN